MRKALRGQLGRNPDLEIATMETASKIRSKPTAADVKAGDGVFVAPTPITAGDEIQIWYGGLLARNGARRVFLHWGVGPGAWQQVRDVEMKTHSPGIFSCLITAAEGGRLEFCFHDGAGNWDNNSGRNWSYTIHNGLMH
jgi:hypothetical protein